MKNKRPKPKKFHDYKYRAIIDQLHERMPGKELETHCTSIVEDILINYEGFEWIEKGPEFRGTPFNFFGLKNGIPYIVELKASLKSFNAPGETQKWRMRELLHRIDYLNIALLQLKLRKALYRIFYDQDMEIFFNGTKAPFEPIEAWIREKLG